MVCVHKFSVYLLNNSKWNWQKVTLKRAHIVCYARVMCIVLYGSLLNFLRMCVCLCIYICLPSLFSFGICLYRRHSVGNKRTNKKLSSNCEHGVGYLYVNVYYIFIYFFVILRHKTSIKFNNNAAYERAQIALSSTCSAFFSSSSSFFEQISFLNE